VSDHRDLTCAELVELVTDYLEGALDRHACERFERHLAYCSGCGTYLDQIRATVAAAGQLTEEDLSGEAKAGLLAAFRDWQRE
jgi:anti-sigma factor RsiW